MTSPLSDLHEVATFFGACHVLVTAGRAVIIDAGLFAAQRRPFREVFSRLGLAPTSVDAIILTHGHLDHAGNAAWLREWTSAPVFAHRADEPHIAGRYPYRGWTRLCGGLEMLGRAVIRYRPVRVDRELCDGDVLPWWGGLRVVHLPGHTTGHCALWSARHQLLFCGDLVAIWRWWTEFPPFYFNTEPKKLLPSLRRALDLNPRLVVPNHYSRSVPFDPANLATRFRQFAERKLLR